RTFISMVERGERNVTIATVEKLARALDCGLYHLMPDSVE
ncbi:MAG TPA: transcriptional regulator, partial [Planctomycetaceae bacterium]|nr:transcriptional regulator [Planctomycetaceae bacterium]